MFQIPGRGVSRFGTKKGVIHCNYGIFISNIVILSNK